MRIIDGYQKGVICDNKNCSNIADYQVNLGGIEYYFCRECALKLDNVFNKAKNKIK